MGLGQAVARRDRWLDDRRTLVGRSSGSMLIKWETLERIKSGDVTLAFRRWRKPTVKSGGTLRTAIGMLSISHVAKTTARNISGKEARRAGYDGKASDNNFASPACNQRNKAGVIAAGCHDLTALSSGALEGCPDTTRIPSHAAMLRSGSLSRPGGRGTCRRRCRSGKRCSWTGPLTTR